MEQSNYIEYIRKYFPGLVRNIVETQNGTENPSALKYFHKQDLRPELSVSGKWESLNINNTLVAADYVALNSTLPLKIRDTYGKASGEIPKMGMEKFLNEQQLQDLDTLIALKRPDTAIAAKLFQDTKAVIGGIWEKNEYAYLLGLSTGVSLVEDSANVGIGIRVDYGYPADRKFGVPVVWSNPAATPLTDISTRILAKAKSEGKTVVKIKVSLATMNNILKTTEAKDFFALSIGNFGTTKPIPRLAVFNPAVKDEFGYVFEVVDRTVTVERDGVRSVLTPWSANMVIAQTSDIVGTLTYAMVAEDNHRVAGVEYETADGYILVSKYRENKPLAEFTSSQARVVPVVSETVYQMDSNTVQA